MKEVRALAPDAIIIAGGFNMIPEYAYGVDYVVLGSGGIIFPKMLNILFWINYVHILFAKEHNLK